MPKVIKLNENDLRNIVNRVISESNKHDVKWTKNFKKFFNNFDQIKFAVKKKIKKNEKKKPNSSS